MNRYACTTLVLLSVMMTAKSVSGAETGNTDKGQSIAANCSACHGNQGNITANATTPRLAQQVQQYIVKQLHDFKSGARQNPIMGTMASMLSNQDVLDVAAYFSSQKMTATASDTAPQAADGEKIYKGGIPKGLDGKPVPACSSCHGLDSRGITPAFPRLAGQHPQYIAMQLNTFKIRSRQNDTNKIMRDIASRLTDKQIKAVAEYLGSL